MKMVEKIIKKGKPIKDEVEKEALEGLFSGLQESARSAMKGGLNKVDKLKAVVSADNKEDLKKGLEKAKEVVDSAPDMKEPIEKEESIESEGEEVEGEGKVEEIVELCSDASAEEIEAIIKKLEELKRSKIG